MMLGNTSTDSMTAGCVDLMDVAFLHATDPLERSVLRLLWVVLEHQCTHEHQCDISALLRALAMDQRGIDRIRIEQLAEKIESGISIADAVQCVPDLFSDDTSFAIQIAGDPKSLSHTCHSLISGDELAGEDHSTGHKSSVFRAIRQAVFYLFIITFMFVFIVPTFEKMFDEFGLRLPTPTKLVIAASKWVADYAAILFMVVTAVVLKLTLPRLRLFLRRGMKSGLNILNWRKTLVNDNTRLLTVLAVATASGSMKQALVTLANKHPNKKIRRKLTTTEQQVDSDSNVWDALAQSGVLSRRERTAIKSASNAETQSWLLRWCASRRHERSLFWRSLFHRMFSFVVLTFFAIVVTVTCVSLFMPLVSLISGLS